MLSLDSDKWGRLEHAYGSASDIPALLKALPQAKVRQQSDAEPWFSLWSSLCHQCDVYSASYAAFPHIVEAAAMREPSDRAEFLFMASTIESMRHREISPQIAPEHELAYRQALKKAIPLVLEALEVETDKGWFQALLAAITAFRGYPDLSQGVADLERVSNCPNCNKDFVQRGYDWFDDNAGAT